MSPASGRIVSLPPERTVRYGRSLVRSVILLINKCNPSLSSSLRSRFIGRSNLTVASQVSENYIYAFITNPMRKVLTTIFITLFIAAILYKCATCFEAIDKKTGLIKHSNSLEESKKKKVFLFEVIPSKQEIDLPSGKRMKITNAWVEHAWSYESKPVLGTIYVKKQDWQNLIIEERNYSYTDYDSYLMGDSRGYFGIAYSDKDSLGILFKVVDSSKNDFKFFIYRVDKNIIARSPIIDTVEFKKMR